MNVIDLCCGRGGGLKFLNDNYGFNMAVGVEINSQQIKHVDQSIQVIHNDVEELRNIEELDTMMNQLDFNGFDILLCLEGIRHLNNTDLFLN